MDRISDKTKSLASLAVFRELYNTHKDIFTVISEFIKQIIIEDNLHTFSLQEMCDSLNQTYGFELPSAVIKTSLKKVSFLDRNKTIYTTNTYLDNKQIESFKEISQSVELKNNRIIEALITYAKTKRGSLPDSEIEKIKKDFCAYAIGEYKYSDYNDIISAFIIINSNNTDFIAQLNQIKQGVIIFIGLTYNTTENSVDSIDMPLFIYLDTEVLFHLAGYNGILFKELFNEFYELVEQINRKRKKKIIHLRYFIETSEEIDRYFAKAEQIVRHKVQLNPTKQAMVTLVSACKTPNQVEEKRTEFYQLLKDKEIKLDGQESYYDKNQIQFNIEHEKFYKNKEEGISDDDITRKLTLLNYINIKRGTKSQNVFKNIGHILLSANKLTFKIAYDEELRPSNQIPLATDLDFLTNRFWLSLNKGLNSTMSLRSFDIITKAQIIMSTHVNDSLNKIYDQLEKEEKEGKLDIQRKKICLASLRQKIVKPEEIIDQNEDTYLNIISINDNDRFIAEQAIHRKNNIENKEKLEHELLLISEMSARKDQSILKAAKEIASIRNKKIENDYKQQLNKYNEKKEEWISRKRKKEKANHSMTVIIYIAIILLIFFINHSTFTLSYILSSIISLLIFAIPFFRPLIDHTPIKRAFHFIISKKEQKAKQKDWMIQYDSEHKMPIKRQITIEECYQELIDEQN